MIDPIRFKAIFDLTDALTKRQIKKEYINEAHAKIYLFFIEVTADAYYRQNEAINQRLISGLMTRLKIYMQDVLGKNYEERWNDFQRQINECKNDIEKISCIKDWTIFLSDELSYLIPSEQIKNIEKEFGVEGKLPYFLKLFYKRKTKREG